jgi:hypothetical protein
MTVLRGASDDRKNQILKSAKLRGGSRMTVENVLESPFSCGKSREPENNV